MALYAVPSWAPEYSLCTNQSVWPSPTMPQWPSMLTDPNQTWPAQPGNDDSEASSPPKKKRRPLTEEQKLQMFQYAIEHPHAKQQELGEIFGCERSTVSKTLIREKKRRASSSTPNGDAAGLPETPQSSHAPRPLPALLPKPAQESISPSTEDRQTPHQETADTLITHDQGQAQVWIRMLNDLEAAIERLQGVRAGVIEALTK